MISPSLVVEVNWRLFPQRFRFIANGDFKTLPRSLRLPSARFCAKGQPKITNGRLYLNRRLRVLMPGTRRAYRNMAVVGFLCAAHPLKKKVVLSGEIKAFREDRKC